MQNVVDGFKIIKRLITWIPCWRIIPSRFPPIDLFERVTNQAEFDAIHEIEQLTNPRLLDEIGDLRLVAKEERIYGDGSSLIMAAFTHLPLFGSRFTDGSYGVYYAGNSLETAIAETKYHREKFLKSFNSPRTQIDMRVLLADLTGKLHDIAEHKTDMPAIYHPDNYESSQSFGKQLRAHGTGDASFGIKYASVRHRSGECVAIFRPKVLSNCRQERHLCYVWDGEKISHIYRKEANL